jgi:predicted DNA-binding transcriptional regulator YafY
MRETSSRLLDLLSLLQARRDWAGAELAERLEVSGRTIRRDVGRLRALGYPVESLTGPAGGYRLRAGTAMPPLLLDEEEAIAIAVGLRTAARASVTGIEEASVRALVKLEQVLPKHLRRRVAALGSATIAAPVAGPTVDPQHLTTIATACRDSECLRFDYRSRDGTATRREVEPLSLVNFGRRWYLVGWDRARAGWRTFRVDRLSRPAATGMRFTARGLPAKDAADYVEQSIAVLGAATRRTSPSTPRPRRSRRACPMSRERSSRSTRTAASTGPPTTTSNGWRSASPCSASTSTCTGRRRSSRSWTCWPDGCDGLRAIGAEPSNPPAALGRCHAPAARSRRHGVSPRA